MNGAGATGGALRGLTDNRPSLRGRLRINWPDAARDFAHRVGEAGKQKGTLNKQSALKIQKLFLYAKDRVFGSFGDAELHNPLGLDLDGLAGSRVTADTSFAIDQNELA